jgi:hypothetical protein
MSAKKEYYKNYVDRKIRVKKLIYFLILLIAFIIVLYDSFINGLPFHYILFFFAGRYMSLILKKTQKAKLTEDGKLSVDRNIIGLLIIVCVILLRIFVFPKILTEFNVAYVSDAVLLILIGWLFGRMSLLSDKIEENAFTGFMNGKSNPEV